MVPIIMAAALAASDVSAMGKLDSPLSMMLRRAAPSTENLRRLMAEDAALPERAKTSKQIQTRFKLQRIPEKIDINRGRPQIEPGTIFDYSEFGEYPHAYLERMSLPMFKKGISDSLRPALTPGTIPYNIDLAREGAQKGGWSWYDMGPYRKFVDKYIDPEEQHLADRFMQLSAPMSINTSVPTEIQHTSALHRLIGELGRMPKEYEFAPRRLGASSGDRTRLGFARDVMESGGIRDLFPGQNITRGPKVSAYGLGKQGNLYVPAMDRHSLGALNLPESTKAEGKGGAGLILQELAARSGMMPSQFQASQWVGRLGRVGRKDSDPAAWALILDRMAREDASLKGKNPTQHMIDILTGRDDLGVTGYTQNFADGGPVAKAIKWYISNSRILGGKDTSFVTHGPFDSRDLADKFINERRNEFSNPLLTRSISGPADLMETEAYKKNRRLWDKRLPIEEFAGGGDVRPLIEYIEKRLPKSVRAAPLIHRDDMRGSGREVFQMGDDKLVKIAKRPRGLYEQTLEGQPDVAANLPRLHWRSPDNELTVVENMPMTPRSSQQLFLPMMQRLAEIGAAPHSMRRQFGVAMDENYPGGKWWRAHREDPEVKRMMEEAGIGGFLPKNLHTADFFFAPHRHWSMRNMPMFQVPGEGGRLDYGTPTLLDPGAMDYRIGNPNFERTHARSFENMLNERIKGVLPPPLRASAADLVSDPTRMARLPELGIGHGTDDFIGETARWPAPIDSETPTDEIMRLIRGAMPRSSAMRGLEGSSTVPFRRGGAIDHEVSKLRDHLAGGGVPRNWLRGIEGSKFDEIFSNLGERYRIHGTDLKREEMLKRGEDVPEILGGVPKEAREGVVKGYLGELARKRAIQQWIDKNLRNYVARDMGAPHDPLTREDPYVAQSIKTVNPGDLPEHLFGKYEDPYAEIVRWRRPRSLLPTEREANFKARAEYQKRVEDFKANAPAWVKNAMRQDEFRAQFKPHLKADQQFHDIDPEWWSTHAQPKISEILDWVNHAVTPNEQGVAQHLPENLARISVPQAYEASKKWHAELARKAEEERAGLLSKGTKVHKEYPGGFKWVKYNPVAEDAGGVRPIAEMGTLKNALKAEGDAMGHCVGSYCDDVAEGRTQIYSLRDPKGRPHVTVEVTPQTGRHHRSQAAYNRLPQEIRDAYQAHFESTGKHSMDFGKDFPQWVEENYPGFIKNPPLDIVQIKGKANRAPTAEYLPYVQDFVRSGKWGEVGDFRNTGLVKLHSRNPNGDPTGSYMYATPQELQPFRRYMWQGEKGKPKLDEPLWLTEDEMVQRATSSTGSYAPSPAPRGTYPAKNLGPDELRDYLRNLGESMRDQAWRYDLPKDWKPQGYAKGGQVNPEIDAIIDEAEQKYGLPGVLHSLAEEESKKNPAARGKLDEIGLFQFRPKTAKWLGINPEDPRQSALGAGAFLKYLVERFGSLDLALAAYNWGEGNLEKLGAKKIPESTRKYIGRILERLIGRPPQGEKLPASGPGSAIWGQPQTSLAEDPSYKEAMELLGRLSDGESDDDMFERLMLEPIGEEA